MSADYAKKERAFLDSLEPDTGRGLETWLKLIDGAQLTERNDIIDWLRQHGFTFSRASWIERIYHNGGRPIYAAADGAPAAPLADSGPDPSSSKNQDTIEPPAPMHQQAAEKVAATTEKPSRPKSSRDAGPQAGKDVAQDTDDLDAVIVKAKGLRPLAQHMVRELQSIAPEAVVSAQNSMLLFKTGGVAFAVVAVSAKDLRLGLALKGETPGAPFQAPKFTVSQARNCENMTHMLVLDDVRQFDDAVVKHAQRAASAK